MDSRRRRPRPPRAPPAVLLDLDRASGLFELAPELVGLFALDALLDGLRGLVDQGLGLLRAHAGRRPSPPPPAPAPRAAEAGPRRRRSARSASAPAPSAARRSFPPVGYRAHRAPVAARASAAPRPSAERHPSARP